MSHGGLSNLSLTHSCTNH